MLSQIDLPEARQQSPAMARSGDPDALAGLDALSSAGGDDVSQTLMASGKPAKLLAVAD